LIDAEKERQKLLFFKYETAKYAKNTNKMALKKACGLKSMQRACRHAHFRQTRNLHRRQQFNNQAQQRQRYGQSHHRNGVRGSSKPKRGR
ncbi:hypothetical protein OAM67_01855, partial [bacterium]|nr:hypothetical protein [bacterium]